MIGEPNDSADTGGSPTDRDVPDTTASGVTGAPAAGGKRGESVWLKTRPFWATVLLIIVGVYSFLRYPHTESDTFYSTVASVIATLYVAIALSVFGVKDSNGSKVGTEGWVYMVASSAGLVASLRALSVGRVHDVWQMRLLTGLTVVGVTAAVLLVAERLIAWQVSGQPIPVLWTVLFIVAAVVLAIFP